MLNVRFSHNLCQTVNIIIRTIVVGIEAPWPSGVNVCWPVTSYSYNQVSVTVACLADRLGSVVSPRPSRVCKI